MHLVSPTIDESKCVSKNQSITYNLSKISIIYLSIEIYIYIHVCIYKGSIYICLADRNFLSYNLAMLA